MEFVKLFPFAREFNIRAEHKLLDIQIAVPRLTLDSEQGIDSRPGSRLGEL